MAKIKPDLLKHLKTVKNVDSLGNPITVITLISDDRH